MLDAARLDAWWADTYPLIVADLGLDADADADAATLLARLLAARATPALHAHHLDLGGHIVVAGDGPDLDAELRAAPPRPDEHLVVADAAIGRVLRHGHAVALVVTDLDGDTARLTELNAAGVPLAVHAHGDNMPLLRTWVPRLQGPLLGTRQTTAPEPAMILSPGGFTDGDRAVLIAARLGAQRIRLVGFDLTGEPGPGTRDPARKRRKMRWGARILEAARGFGVPLVDAP